MKYKAKDSYKKLKDEKNFNAFNSPAKHVRLMDGEIIEVDNLPKELKKHLEEVKGAK